MAIVRRNNTYHLVRRVPARFKSVEKRRDVWFSLKTDSETEAKEKAPAVWAEALEGWEARLDGDTSDAEARFDAARRIAQRKGFRYLPAAQVAKLPLPELLDRIEATQDRTGRVNMTDAAALLGTAEPPEITVTGALELFWQIARARMIGKSEDQMRRWKNPRIKAVKNFVRVIGDRPIAQITTDDMLDFKEWWTVRLENEGMTPNSANKDFTHFADVLDTVNKTKRLGLDIPLRGHAFKGGKTKKRKRGPFSTPWITGKILAPDALAGLDPAARMIVLLMVNTGARPSEPAGLMSHHIQLDGPIPLLSIEPEGRTLKNENSERKIPLVGVSLEAAREALSRAQSAGMAHVFPEYFGKDRVSYVVNRYFRDNGLLEGDSTTFYSLRHSFEDRMIEAGVLDRVRRDLFGHALQEERYGEGGGDEVRYRAVKAIAL